MAIQIRVSVGLGEQFRSLCIDEGSAVAAYTLSELQRGTATDIAFNRNVGTYQGTGITRGIQTPLPEEALGVHFTGYGYIDVPDDGDGFTLSGQSHARSLSFTGGSQQIVLLLRTSTNDGVLRHILSKINGSTEGWRITLYNGRIYAHGYRGGSFIYSPFSAVISDGNWHVIVVDYSPTRQSVVLFVDNVGVTETTAGETFVKTNEAMHIGALSASDATAGHGFIGDLSYCTLNKKSDLLLAGRLEAARVWTDISQDVLDSSPVTIQRGIPGTDPFQRMAGASTCTFRLDNSQQNSANKLGYYTPEHIYQRSGWGIDLPIKVDVYDDILASWRTRFRGKIQSIQPVSGVYDERNVTVMAASWFHYTGSYAVGTVPTQINSRSHRVFARLLDQARTPPPGVDFTDGVHVFAFALDKITQKSSLLSALTDVQLSEGGYAYERADGTVVFESTTERYLKTSFDGQFDQKSIQLSAGVSSDRIKNRIKFVYSYREVGTPNSVLFSMHKRIRIEGNSEVQISVQYRDPVERSAEVGAIDIVTPIASTHYTMNAAQDGSGADITSAVHIFLEGLGGNQTELRIENTGSATGWFILTSLQGTPLFTYDRTAIIEEDRDSIRKQGLYELERKLLYASNSREIQGLAQRVLALFKDSSAKISAVKFFVDSEDSTLSNYLAIDIGSLVGIGESMTALEVNTKRFVNSIRESFWPWAMDVQWSLIDAAQENFWLVGVVDRSEVGISTYVG